MELCQCFSEDEQVWSPDVCFDKAEDVELYLSSQVFVFVRKRAEKREECYCLSHSSWLLLSPCCPGLIHCSLISFLLPLPPSPASVYIYMCVCGRGSGSFVKAFLGTNNGLSQPAKQTSAERGQLWKSTNKEQKNLSNVRLISLCYGNHFVLRLREIGLLLSTSGLIVRLTSMKMWNAAAFSCSLHSSSLSWYKKTPEHFVLLELLLSSSRVQTH